MNDLKNWRESVIAEQATGCAGAGNYRAFALKNGYQFCEVLDWTSSAGDWQFLISKDGFEWLVLYQTNNFPKAGFSYYIDNSMPFYGNLNEVYQQIEEMT